MNYSEKNIRGYLCLFQGFVEEEGSKVVERLIRLAREKLIQIVLLDWVINESIALINENNRKGKINSTETKHILSELINMIRIEIQHENLLFILQMKRL